MSKSILTRNRERSSRMDFEHFELELLKSLRLARRIVAKYCRCHFYWFDKIQYDLSSWFEKDFEKRMVWWIGRRPWYNVDEIVSLLERRAGKDRLKSILQVADHAVSHSFDLLGSGFRDYGTKINWQTDIRSGYTFDPNLHHSRIRWISLPQGVDIKMPWELSRCQHFAALGMADWMTRNGLYYDEWVVQISDWIDSNRVGYGVNWVCPMDVAIRAVNWLNALWMFGHRIEIDRDREFLRRMDESLWMHGMHIQWNLEWGGGRNRTGGNHFLANLVGLLGLGAYFGSSRSGRIWFNFAHKWIERELLYQVNEDGTNTEGSTSYHRLVLEMFLWAEWLAGAFGRPFGTNYREIVGKMLAFVNSYTTPCNTAAQFGDNDSGRLLSFGGSSQRNHKYLLNLAGPDNGVDHLLLRPDGSRIPEKSHSNQAYEMGGYYFFRNEHLWLGFRGGAIASHGVHAHCDQLSLVLHIGGVDLFVDRGTGFYSPDIRLRNKLRSTESHNVVQINNWQQNHFDFCPLGLFRMEDNTKSTVNVLTRTAEVFIVGSSHHGFERFNEKIRYYRFIKVVAGRLVVTDFLGNLSSCESAVVRWHLSPGLVAECLDSVVIIEANDHVVKVEFKNSESVALLHTEHSEDYGVVSSAQVIQVRIKKGEFCAWVKTVVSYERER